MRRTRGYNLARQRKTKPGATNKSPPSQPPPILHSVLSVMMLTPHCGANHASMQGTATIFPVYRHPRMWSSRGGRPVWRRAEEGRRGGSFCHLCGVVVWMVRLVGEVICAFCCHRCEEGESRRWMRRGVVRVLRTVSVGGEALVSLVIDWRWLLCSRIQTLIFQRRDSRTHLNKCLKMDV